MCGDSMKREQMAEYAFPGSFVSETSSELCRHNNADQIECPSGAFAFRFFERVTQTATLEDGRTHDHIERENVSGWYYPGGDVLTVDNVEALDGDYGILLSNMRSNGWDRVVRTRLGNFQPLNADDAVC